MSDRNSHHHHSTAQLPVAMDWCPSCCPACSIGQPAVAKSRPSLALKQLLHAGTLYIGITVEGRHAICCHSHAEDGWHPFDAPSIIPHLADKEDIALCDELRFLVQHHFIVATFASPRDRGDGVLVRIYLVPFDLPGIRTLRNARPDILTTARTYLSTLIPRISSELVNWEARSVEGLSRLFPICTVSNALL